MRGFFFSLDMVFAAIAVMAALTLIGFVTTHSLTVSLSDDLAFQAKDASLMAAYGNVPANPSIANSTQWACASSFKRISSSAQLDPLLVNSWVISKSCVVRP